MASILRNARVDAPRGYARIVPEQNVALGASQVFVAKDVSLRSVHLDALRGVAALIVVVGHERGLFFNQLTTGAHDVASIGNKANSDPSITIGHEAVMVFFVLSGFLVGGCVLRLMGNNIWSWPN